MKGVPTSCSFFTPVQPPTCCVVACRLGSQTAATATFLNAAGGRSITQYVGSHSWQKPAPIVTYDQGSRGNPLRSLCCFVTGISIEVQEVLALPPLSLNCQSSRASLPHYLGNLGNSSSYSWPAAKRTKAPCCPSRPISLPVS